MDTALPGLEGRLDRRKLLAFQGQHWLLCLCVAPNHMHTGVTQAVGMLQAPGSRLNPKS